VSDEDDASTMSEHPQALLAIKENIFVIAVVDPSAGPLRGCNKTSAFSGAPRYHEGMAVLGEHGRIIDFCVSLDTAIDTLALLALKQACAGAPLSE
jgi:hypothetical protein